MRIMKALALGALWAAVLLVSAAPSAAFETEIPLKERAAARTAADFLELYAPSHIERGRVDCGEQLTSSTRQCTLRWAQGKGSGRATITAFVGQRNGRRLASIHYRLKERIPSCTAERGAGCTATTKGRVTFRLRSGARQ